MHRPIFGHPFAVLAAPVLLSVIVFNFLNKKKASVRRNAGDADSNASGSLTAPTGTNSNGSSSSPEKTDKGEFSSSTAPIVNHYEVFLSFRGQDTRKTFTDHLYNGLINAGICTFKDEEELRQGEKIRPDLRAAIKNSKILIPILSMNYGESSWCLDELVQIMECKNITGHIVLPIFYQVEPAHLRYQIGSFGDKFHKHESRLRKRYFEPTILEKRKQALIEVSTLKGWNADGYEGELVKLVVRKVLRELKKKFELVIPENLIGIDNHVEKVMEFVNHNSHATLFVGICGMGGIGKTTLAKAIYNKLSNKFECRSFIADIRESWKHNGVVRMQNQLVYDILKEKNQVHYKDGGIELISSNFKNKRVLILLDDMDDHDQLKALAGNHDWFSSGSIIIITTRNKSILDNARVNYTFEHEEMDREKSLILFSKHAFQRDFPPSEFVDLTHGVVSTTGGLPLALEVLGSFLRGKEPKLWRGTINKLKKVPHEKVQEKLKISYEALTHEQKQIFLDIACFFIGTDRRIASYMWDNCYFFPDVEIEELRSRSLIKIGDNHEIKMHDQLRDLGREIVRKENKKEPQYRSRLWDFEEVFKVLKENKGTEKIEAICLSRGETIDQGDNILKGKQFKRLRNLRFLDVSGATFRGDFESCTKKLKWLRWHNCPLTFEAKEFNVKELVVLELSRSKISSKWQGWNFVKTAEKLKFLNLTHCQSLEGTFFLSAFKNLEVLILKGCRSLKQIDSSIGNMKTLARLNLSGCISLEELPTEVTKLEALELLLLRNCGQISSLSDNIGAMQNLGTLDVCGTGIKKLPNDIRRLRKLKKLEVLRCWELQCLPELPSGLTYLSVTCQSFKMTSLSHLTDLKQLHLLNYKIPKCILELPSTLLELSEYSQLNVAESKLQRSLNAPFKLYFLEVLFCETMDTLDVSQLNHLKTLSARGCCNIHKFPGVDKLKYLESMTIKGSMERFPNSKGLKKLEIENCNSLIKIQGLNRLEYLEELCISKCTLIERLDLPKSKDMKRLCVQYCESLVKIHDLDKLQLLEELCVVDCASIERLDLPKFGGLKILRVENCKHSVEIQGLDKLDFLAKISIIECTSLERLDLSRTKHLKILNVQNCQNLVEIQGLNWLEFLEELCFVKCALIERLDLPKSKCLKKLSAQFCQNLVEIQGLDKLELLEKLSTVECTSIERLDLSKSRSLKILHVQCCKNLIEIEHLNILGSVKKLRFFACYSIKRLDLPKSKDLKVLDAQCCKNLVEIRGLQWLKSLEKLNISCTSIEKLDLSKSKGLKMLIAQNCNKLVEILGLDKLECLTIVKLKGSTIQIPKGLKIFGQDN